MFCWFWLCALHATIAQNTLWASAFEQWTIKMQRRRNPSTDVFPNNVPFEQRMQLNLVKRVTALTSINRPEIASTLVEIQCVTYAHFEFNKLPGRRLKFDGDGGTNSKKIKRLPRTMDSQRRQRSGKNCCDLSKDCSLARCPAERAQFFVEPNRDRISRRLNV